MIDFPSIVSLSEKKILHMSATSTADVTKLTRISSLTSWEETLKLFNEGNYSAISCDVGTLSVTSLKTLIQVHNILNIKYSVLEEKEWLKKEVLCLQKVCKIPTDEIAIYADKLLYRPNNTSALDSNQCVLLADLATIARKRWINFSIIQSIADILNMDNAHTSVLMLNNALLVTSDDLPAYIEDNVAPTTKFVVCFANVGKTDEDDVFFSRPGNPGCHWLLIYIDLTLNKLFYCDTMHWDAPKYLKRDLVPIVGAIYDRIEMKTKPPGGIVIAHSGGVGSYHICTQRCLKNIPLQACSNVCGIAMAILGGIACAAPRLWGGCNLNRKADIPATLQWLSNPSTHSDFLRCVIISWLITNTLDVSLIGVDPENIPRPKSVPASCRRQRTPEKNKTSGRRKKKHQNGK